MQNFNKVGGHLVDYFRTMDTNNTSGHQPSEPGDDRTSATTAEVADYIQSEIAQRVAGLIEAWRQSDRQTLQVLAEEVRNAAAGQNLPDLTATVEALERDLLAEEADASDLSERFEALIYYCRRAADLADSADPSDPTV